MKRRICALMLAVILLTGLCFSTAAQASAPSDSEMLGTLALLGIMNGDGSGDLKLDDNVTRAQLVKMAIMASSYRESGKDKSTTSPYPDVPSGHWASGYVNMAKTIGWVTGYTNGTFRPDKSVTLAEAVTIVLRLLGYSESDFTGVWPKGQMALYRSLGLDDNITDAAGDELDRGGCAQLIYNALTATTKNGAVYCVTMGYGLDQVGDIDYLSLVNSKIKGPYIVNSLDWEDMPGFVPDKVYINDRLSDLGSIETGDVMYYVPEISSVFCYSDRVTGVIEAIGPNRTSPAYVVVSGISYNLGTSAVSVALSSMGGFGVGDTVTLLFGRNDEVVSVLEPDTLAESVYGLITECGVTTYETASGASYDAKYIDVLSTDGHTYRYATDKKFYTGNIVSVDFDTDGINIEKVEMPAKLSGKVELLSSTIGSTTVSPDVNIMDVYENKGMLIPMARLTGATLANNDILFYIIDDYGQISDLILNDFTGDMHSYCLLTESERVMTGSMSFMSVYKCIMGGSEQTLTATDASFNVKNGGVQIKFKDGKINGMVNLEEANITRIYSDYARTTNQKLNFADSMEIYIKKGDDYLKASLDYISDTAKYDLTGWYDGNAVSGGRLRVIIAVEKQ